MKTRNLNGLKIVGIAALLFSAAAMVPANADVRRDNDHAKVEVYITKNIHTDLYAGDRRDDHDWNRDRDKDRDRDRDRHEDRDHDRR